jgi:hypothetical protein
MPEGGGGIGYAAASIGAKVTRYVDLGPAIHSNRRIIDHDPEYTTTSEISLHANAYATLSPKTLSYCCRISQ